MLVGAHGLLLRYVNISCQPSLLVSFRPPLESMYLLMCHQTGNPGDRESHGGGRARRIFA